MPNPSTQDLVKGVDMTGIVNPAAVDFNNLVDQSHTYAQPSVIEGTGLIIITKDTAPNTPNTPNAVTTPKWKRNIWMRIPFNAAIGPFTIYCWNDTNASNVSLLKWSQIVPDLTVVNADITALQTAVAAATNTANNAYNLASSVNATAILAESTANAASTAAANATTTANAASTLATNTAAQLATVQTGITNATNTANAASTDAAAAQASVTAFVASHNTAVLTETAAQNTDGTALAIGANVRLLTAIAVNVNSIVSIIAGKIKFTNAGTYIIDAEVGSFMQNDRAQTFVVKDSDNSVKILGNSVTEISTDASTHISRAVGVLIVVANEIYRIETHTLQGNSTRGKASNLSTEYYSTIKIDQIA